MHETKGHKETKHTMTCRWAGGRGEGWGGSARQLQLTLHQMSSALLLTDTHTSFHSIIPPSPGHPKAPQTQFLAAGCMGDSP